LVSGTAGVAAASVLFSSLPSVDEEALASALSARPAAAAAAGSAGGVRFVSRATIVSSTLSGELALPRMPRFRAADSASSSGTTSRSASSESQAWM